MNKSKQRNPLSKCSTILMVAVLAAVVVFLLDPWDILGSSRLPPERGVNSYPQGGAVLADSEFAEGLSRTELVETDAVRESAATSSTGLLKILVEDSDGERIGGIALFCSRKGQYGDFPGTFRELGVTDPVGELECELVAGSCRVVSLRGGSLEIDVLAGRSDTVRLVIDECIRVAGVVLLEDGSYASGAEIWGVQFDNRGRTLLAEASASGEFELPALHPKMRFTAVLPGIGHSKSYGLISPSLPVSSPITVVIIRGVGQLTGKIISSGESGFAEVIVMYTSGRNVQLVQENVVTFGWPGFSVACELNDGFHFGSLPAGEIEIHVRAPALPWAKLVSLVRDGQETTEMIYLDEGVTVAGRTFDDSGNPLAGAVVEELEPGVGVQNARQRVTSDENGDYELRGVATGESLQIVAHLGALRDEHSLLGTETSPVLWNPRLHSGLRIRGVLTGPDGKPIVGRPLTAHSFFETISASKVRATTTNQNGEFSFENCVAAPYRLAVSGAQPLSISAKTVTDVWPSPLPRNIILDADHQGEVHFLLQSGSEAALPGTIQLELIKAGGAKHLFNTKIRDGGGCTVSLPPGAYTAVLRGAGYAPNNLSKFSVYAERGTDLGVIRLLPGEDLTVRVLQAGDLDWAELLFPSGELAHYGSLKGNAATFPNVSRGDYLVRLHGEGCALLKRPIVFPPEETVVKLEAVVGCAVTVWCGESFNASATTKFKIRISSQTDSSSFYQLLQAGRMDYLCQLPVGSYRCAVSDGVQYGERFFQVGPGVPDTTVRVEVSVR